MEYGQIWEEPEHLIDKEDLYGSDKMYHRGPIYSIGFLPTVSCVFGSEHNLHTGMYLRVNTLANIAKSLLSGNSIRLTARLTATSKNTVKKLYRILLAKRSDNGEGDIYGKGDILCKCGQPNIHQGFCSYRYKNSPKRQAFMKHWHKNMNDNNPSDMSTKLKEIYELLLIERNLILKKIVAIDTAIKAVEMHDRIKNSSMFSRQYRHQLKNLSKGLCSCGNALDRGSKTCAKCRKIGREKYQKKIPNNPPQPHNQSKEGKVRE